MNSKNAMWIILCKNPTQMENILMKIKSFEWKKKNAVLFQWMTSLMEKSQILEWTMKSFKKRKNFQKESEIFL